MKTVIEMARQAGARDDGHRFEFSDYKYLERFVALVIANHPPQSYMTWQEGYEAGKKNEREALEKLDWTAIMREGGLVTWGDASCLGDRVFAAIRARGQA